MLKRGFSMKRIIAFILTFALFSCSFLPASAANIMLKSAPLSRGDTHNGMVRVRLSSLGNPSTLKLTVNGSYTVNGKTEKAIASGSVLQVGFSSSTGKLTLTQNGVTTDMGSSFKLRRHAADGTNGIKIAQGRVPSNLYPGDFEFLVRSSSGSYSLYVIVHVYIEDYLYGVLPYEMGNSSGLEALKAQAVTARTYTMRAMSASSASLYDVVDTTSDQVYSGTPSGNANCKAAVDETKGIVAKNGSAFTATYYSASNGGQTEAIKNVWNSTSYPYLVVKDDPYDLANPASRKNSFSVVKNGTQQNATLQNLLNSKAASQFGAGSIVTGVQDIFLHTPKYASPSRLYTKADFHVTYTKNGAAGAGKITFDIFNELEAPLSMSINSGSNELWSVDKTDAGFTVNARRYGHGLGMSQRGAMYMAQMGYTYDQILAFYYEGCTRVQYTFTRSILSPVINGQQSNQETIVENPAEIAPDAPGTATVMPQAGVSMLASPDADAGALVTLPYAAKVTVHQILGDYCLAVYGGLCGYVPLNSLSHDGSLAQTSATPTRLYGYGEVVGTSALNLRSAPSTANNNVVTSIPGKTVLPVFSVSGNWAYVQYGLRVGYVSLDYIEMTKAPDTVLPTNAPGTEMQVLKARVTTEKGSLNLRSSNSATAAVLTTIPQNTVIDVTQHLGDWCAVGYLGYNGYVMTRFLTFLSEEQQNTPAPSPTPTHGNGSAGTNEYAMVTTEKGSLNLRFDRSSTARILRTIPQYAYVNVVARYGDWTAVTYEGTFGYVMTKFLTFISAISPTTAPIIPVTTPVPATATPQPDTTPAVSQETWARVTTEKGSLNLRISENGRVLRTIPQYAVIRVLEKNNDWCQVIYEGTYGYVMTKFLTFLAAAPTDVPTAAPQPLVTPTPGANVSGNTARVTTLQGSLNLRLSPNAKVIRTIPQYAVVEVISRGSDWTQVKYEGYAGYVMTKFLTFLSSSVETPTQPPVSLPTALPTTVPTAVPGIQNGNTARVTTQQGSLNLRVEPNKKVIGTIPQYAIVQVLEYNTSWTKVQYMGLTGYVMTKFLTFLPGTGETNTPVPLPQQTPVTPAQTQTPPAGLTQAPYTMDPTMIKLNTIVLGSVQSEINEIHLRSYCTVDAPVVAVIPKGMFVVISKVGQDWCEVIYEDKNGYCLESELQYVLP